MSQNPAHDSQPQGKRPRTERGRRTLRRLLDAAAEEFGEKGFHDGSISGITKRAGMALGSFYTYYDSKDEIFQALVQDLSAQVGITARNALTDDQNALETEQAALEAFLRFAREHKEIYRIIDEAEFVVPASFRKHYDTTAKRILERLKAGAKAGELREDVDEVHAWAIMGMNVFLGLRYAIWADDETPNDVAERTNALLKEGIAKR